MTHEEYMFWLCTAKGIWQQDVKKLLEKEPYYPKEIKTRVADILYEQIRKYRYLFHIKAE